ncbi:hypothetical protein U9M48_028849, partial [Paspalum notatum var. saurae]
MGAKLLKDQFPSLYNIVNYPQKVVVDVMIQMLPNITFQRALAGDKDTPFNTKFIWKLKLPLKIKIFLYYLWRGVILTKDNLVKRNWTGSQNCLESCSCCYWAIFRGAYWLRFWTMLQREDKSETISLMCKALEFIMMDILPRMDR